MQVAKLADEMGLEAIVPLGRYRGFGGVTDYGSTSFQVYTWAAAVGGQTAFSGGFPPAPAPTMDPGLAYQHAPPRAPTSAGPVRLHLPTRWANTARGKLGAAP